jgi:hypothetical protein
MAPQMVRDFSPAGRGGHLAAKINRQIDEGKFRPMSERFRECQNHT